MYDPPTEKNWVMVYPLIQSYVDAYEEGYQAAKQGKALEDNPYEESGHERDTTYSDEMNYWWYCGFVDYVEG